MWHQCSASEKRKSFFKRGVCVAVARWAVPGANQTKKGFKWTRTPKCLFKRSETGGVCLCQSEEGFLFMEEVTENGGSGSPPPPQVRCLVGGRGASESATEDMERYINRCKGWQTIKIFLWMNHRAAVGGIRWIRIKSCSLLTVFDVVGPKELTTRVFMLTLKCKRASSYQNKTIK